jgi:hypothetical protein
MSTRKKWSKDEHWVGWRSLSLAPIVHPGRFHFAHTKEGGEKYRGVQNQFFIFN